LFLLLNRHLIVMPGGPMAKRSITVTSLLWTWGFFLLVLTGVFIFATRQVERSVVAEAEVRARIAVGLVEYLLSQGDVTGKGHTLAQSVDALGQHLGFRLTYIVDGQVLADSEVGASGVSDMENHADRPEIRAALATGYGQDARHSHTLGRDMLYVAKRFAGVPGVPAGVVRLALPFSDLGGELGRLRSTLLAVLALVFLAGGAVAYGLARSMAGSLREISGVVTAIGEGGFDRRIHIVPAKDFMPLAEAINALAERVGAHVREIEERRKRQTAILDGMAEGVAILDARGRMLAVNRALGTMFPQAGALTGKTPIEAGMSLDIDRYLAGGQAVSGHNGRFELPGGRVAEVTVVPVIGTGGTQVATFHDITEAAAMERIFREFVIDASHRLRTPLTKIRGFAETARDLCATNPGEAVSALSVVIRGADDIKNVIDDLLGAARERYAKAEAARDGGAGVGSEPAPNGDDPASPDGEALPNA
jgi:two-component system, OmpR family, phosphate regulon sensor histidine kinase PhoR